MPMIVTTFEELSQTRNLRDTFFIPSYLDESFFHPKSQLLISEGDLVLDHDLFLDWGKLDALAPEGTWGLNVLVVFGDLILDGGLLNTDMDGGPVLLVQGNVKARNLISGGSDIIVMGNADISDVVFANYNHGYLEVKGQLSAGLLVMVDHSYDLENLNVPVQIFDEDAWDDEDASGLPGHLLKINAVLKREISDLEDLKAQIIDVGDVLNDDAKHRPAP
ncbi:hypothetical protein [Deinococcus enclensis]|uniref:Polymer-forming cytoskeletal protein n=1 Tax=Deinococcus enclensis TaxID=1049582 RepID=A0ABT9MF34_9DEIO|nr:hypothetical protein [Deinococcus enclensis]MDP9765156.1 hypothetical protein [Deinococcus enclensis]